jgi:NAD(P)-dependent dehydrogenase (short-subunit alcohol dehydrogenase family)
MTGIRKNAVVIGGGTGIGEATCLMHERGWRVVVVDRDKSAMERVASDQRSCARNGYCRRR